MKTITGHTQNNNDLIKWLGNFGELGPASVGGKAFHLGQLMKSDTRVPDGFCITTEAFDRFVTRLNLKSLIGNLRQTLLQAADEVFSPLEMLRNAIISSPMPREIEPSILRAYHRLKAAGARGVAVRSSATAEDLPQTSLAGQFATRLNIRGNEALLNAVKYCWASLYSEGAVAYAEAFGIDPGGLKMAVIVQSLVAADKSGVMFTVHPITRDRSRLLIEASYGLGISTVGGIGNPDRYIVDKSSMKLKLLETHISRKSRMAIPFASSEGVQEVEVPAQKQSKPCVTDNEVFALAELGKKIESFFKYPQDIEWAIENGTIYILQSRNITSL